MKPLDVSQLHTDTLLPYVILNRDVPAGLEYLLGECERLAREAGQAGDRARQIRFATYTIRVQHVADGLCVGTSDQLCFRRGLCRRHRRHWFGS